MRTVHTARALAALVTLLAALAGCGSKTVTVEKPLAVTGGAPAATAPLQDASGTDTQVRIAVVTHGQASSPFWAIIRTGVRAAAREMDALVTYAAPDIYSVQRMSQLIDQATATHPDAMVVSIPEKDVGPAIRRAVAAGIPVVSINSGSDLYKSMGVLAHIGQPEEPAGFEAGRRLSKAGVKNALCVNQQLDNTGLKDRCRGLARAMREAGGHSSVLGVDDQSASTPRRIAAAIRSRRIQGVLALNALSGMQSVKAVSQAGRAKAVPVATFDLGPDVLQAVRDGRLIFAVDQQAYLQGYLPIVLLTQLTRYGIFPAQGHVIPTGPNFVTRDNASQALELSRRFIR